MRKPIIFALAALVVVGTGAWLFLQNSIPGFWALDSQASSLTFSSTKNGDIVESHTFHGVTGEVDFSGSFRVAIDLRTVDTGIEIRDERMGHYLFQVEEFPQAMITGTFTPAPFEDLVVDGVMITRVNATLSLHGIEKDVSVDVMVTRLEWDQVRVESVNPLVLQAADFNLEGGLEELRDIVGLESISGTVPIWFQFVFNGGVTP